MPMPLIIRPGNAANRPAIGHPRKAPEKRLLTGGRRLAAVAGSAQPSAHSLDDGAADAVDGDPVALLVARIAAPPGGDDGDPPPARRPMLGDRRPAVGARRAV